MSIFLKIRRIRLKYFKSVSLRAVFLASVTFLILIWVRGDLQIYQKIFEKIYGPSEIFTFGCKIKKLESYDDFMTEIFQGPLKNCSSRKIFPKLVKSYKNVIFVSNKAVRYSNFGRPLKCFYRVIEALNFTKEDFKKVRYVGRKKYFSGPVKVDADFLEVICTVEEKMVYKDYLSFFRIPKLPNTTHVSSQKYNVLILGIETISRLSFLRNFPRTVTYLEDVLDPIEYLGYHKSTNHRTEYENLFHLLTGKTFRNQKSHLIWNIFQRENYYTAYAEDIASLGPFIKLGKFHENPAHHSWTKFNMKILDVMGNPIENPWCIGHSPAYKYLFDYIEKFIDTYDSTKTKHFFGLFWSYSLSNRYKNYGNLVDKDLLELLKKLVKRNIFENTFLFLVSGQGHSFQNISKNPYLQADIEASLPLLWVILPKKFSENHPESRKNVIKNRKRLISIYDIFQTVQTIATNNFEKENNIYDSLGKSLFFPISSFRSCNSLQIADKICACGKF